MGPLLEERPHRRGAQVAAPDQPLIVLLDGEHRGQADQRAVVGEDPDDVGAPADLAVEALQRVGIRYERACALRSFPATVAGADASGAVSTVRQSGTGAP